MKKYFKNFGLYALFCITISIAITVITTKLFKNELNWKDITSSILPGFVFGLLTFNFKKKDKRSDVAEPMDQFENLG